MSTIDFFISLWMTFKMETQSSNFSIDSILSPSDQKIYSEDSQQNILTYFPELAEWYPTNSYTSVECPFNDHLRSLEVLANGRRFLFADEEHTNQPNHQDTRSLTFPPAITRSNHFSVVPGGVHQSLSTPGRVKPASTICSAHATSSSGTEQATSSPGRALATSCTGVEQATSSTGLEQTNNSSGYPDYNYILKQSYVQNNILGQEFCNPSLNLNDTTNQCSGNKLSRKSKRAPSQHFELPSSTTEDTVHDTTVTHTDHKVKQEECDAVPYQYSSANSFPNWTQKQKQGWQGRRPYSRTCTVVLGWWYKHLQYLTTTEMKQVGDLTGLTRHQIKIWWQNRRHTTRTRGVAGKDVKETALEASLPRILSEGTRPPAPHSRSREDLFKQMLQFYHWHIAPMVYYHFT